MMKSSSSRENLPLIGPATNFLRFPARNPDSVLKGLKGMARAFAEAELAIARCEFVRGKELSEVLLGDDHYILAAVRIGIISAIGLGDLRFFDRVVKALADYRKRLPHPEAAVGIEIAEAWIRQWLWIETGYPEWMYRFDLTSVPEPWRQSAAYLGMKIRIVRGVFESAYAASSLFLNFICSCQEGITAACAYAKIACAIACREIGRKDEMMMWLGEVIRTLAPHGIFLPFLMFMYGMHRSPVEAILSESAPDQLPRYRELSKSYFRNLIRMRNHYTGERLTEDFSFREFYLAMLLKRGHSYKELAERFGISVGRMRNLVSILYEKLHVHSRSGLKDFVC